MDSELDPKQRQRLIMAVVALTGKLLEDCPTEEGSHITEIDLLDERVAALLASEKQAAYREGVEAFAEQVKELFPDHRPDVDGIPQIAFYHPAEARKKIDELKTKVLT